MVESQNAAVTAAAASSAEAVTSSEQGETGWDRLKKLYRGFMVGSQNSVTAATVSSEIPALSEQAETGWDRLKKLYRGESYILERDLCLKMTKTSFVCGFFVGGLNVSKEADKRFDAYAEGKKFLNRRDAFRRKNDFRMLMFLKNGFKMGIRACLVTSAVMVGTTHTTIYRNYFSPWYFPVYSGFSAFFMHRATACGIFAFPLGIYGQAQAFGLGLSTGSMISAMTWLYALGHDKTVNDGYILFKTEYERLIAIRNEEEERILRLMKDEKILLKSTALKRLKEIDEQQLLNLVEDKDDDGKSVAAAKPDPPVATSIPIKKP